MQFENILKDEYNTKIILENGGFELENEIVCFSKDFSKINKIVNDNKKIPLYFGHGYIKESFKAYIFNNGGFIDNDDISWKHNFENWVCLKKDLHKLEKWKMIFLKTVKKQIWMNYGGHYYYEAGKYGVYFWMISQENYLKNIDELKPYLFEN